MIKFCFNLFNFKTMEEIDPGPRSRALIPLKFMNLIELADYVNRPRDIDPRDINSRLTTNEIVEIQQVFGGDQRELVDAFTYMRGRGITNPRTQYVLLERFAKDYGILTSDYVVLALSNGNGRNGNGLEAHV